MKKKDDYNYCCFYHPCEKYEGEFWCTEDKNIKGDIVLYFSIDA